MQSTDLNTKAVTPHLVWVYDMEMEALDSSTWLNPTRELRKMGWQVTLITIGTTGYHKIHGVEVLCFSRPDIYFLRKFGFFIKVVGFIITNWGKIDVVLFHEIGALWLIPLRYLRFLTGKKMPLYVMDIRSAYMTDPVKETIRDYIRRLFLVIIHHWGSYLVDGCLTITQRMAEYIYISPQKLWGIWPSGVDLEEFSQAQVERRWPEAGEPIHIIYIGSTSYGRNLMSVCKAVIKANCQGMKFIFSIYGIGDEMADLEKFAAQSSAVIRVHEPVPHEEVWKVLAQAHIGVLPFPDETKFRVSSPIKLFEYMGAGLPVLVTRIVCHTDVIKDRNYAFWVETSDVNGFVEALRIVWKSRDSLQELGRNAAMAVLDWTWTASTKKMKVALEKGLNFPGRG